MVQLIDIFVSMCVIFRDRPIYRLADIDTDILVSVSIILVSAKTISVSSSVLIKNIGIGI